MNAVDSPFTYGYNTNGFSFHRLHDVFDILAELGYGAVALTLDVHHLDPLRVTRSEIRSCARQLDGLGLRVAIETGARFVLDPRVKHWPTLLEESAAERGRREDFLLRCHEIGTELGADLVSFWSGVCPEEVSRERALDRLCAFLERFESRTRGSGPGACLEPEPGMLISSMSDWNDLRARLGPSALRLALDIGHVYVTEEVPAETILESHADCLGQVTLDDSPGTVHEHLPPGEGVADWSAILTTLKTTIGFTDPLYVELGRHGHDAVRTATQTLQFLRETEARLDP